MLAMKSDGDQKIIGDLFGGLSLVPYGILLLFGAFALALGWISWANLGAPLFPGIVAAWLADRWVSQYYRAKYNFRFGLHKVKGESPAGASNKRFVIVFLAGLALAGLINATLPLQVRLMPLLFGVTVGLRGRDWMQRGWAGFGALHLAAGVVPLGMGVAPLLLNIPLTSPYFGAASVFELAAIGLALAVIGLLEHFIFIRLHKPGVNS